MSVKNSRAQGHTPVPESIRPKLLIFCKACPVGQPSILGVKSASSLPPRGIKSALIDLPCGQLPGDLAVSPSPWFCCPYQCYLPPLAVACDSCRCRPRYLLLLLFVPLPLQLPSPRRFPLPLQLPLLCYPPIPPSQLCPAARPHHYPPFPLLTPHPKCLQ